MPKALEKYTDPKNAAAFAGITGFKKNQNLKDYKDIKKKEFYSRHSPLIKKFTRNKVVVAGIDDTWQIDLLDVKNIANHNSGNNFILTVIDVFSKKAWAKPIKTKLAANVLVAFKKILKEGRVPKRIHADKGREFKGEFSKYLKENNINIYSTSTELKAQVVERFNRTIRGRMYRLFSFNESKKKKLNKFQNYTNFLEDLVTNYNNSYHRSIKTTPNSVNKKNEKKIREILYPKSAKLIEIHFNKGDYVRLPVDSRIPNNNFSKRGYTPNWRSDVYIVQNILLRHPAVYKIQSIEGEELDGYFYRQELQKVADNEFPFDTYKVIQEEGEQVLVQHLNSKTDVPKRILRPRK